MDNIIPSLYTKWIDTNRRLPPVDSLVMTKIDDERGIRNQQALRYRRGLWFVKDNTMYVYYKPTHWRPFEEGEK